MSYISQSNLENLQNGFRLLFIYIFEALKEGRLEDALVIAEETMAFLSEIIEKNEREANDNTNLFVFVESPQRGI